MRRLGYRPVTKAFDTKADAERWARRIETDIDEGRHMEPSRVRVSEIIDAYQEDIEKTRETGRTKAQCLRTIVDEIGVMTLLQLTPVAIADWLRDSGRGPATSAQYLSYLGSALRHARHTRPGLVADPIPKAREILAHKRLIGPSKKRTRRPSREELDLLCGWFDSHSAMPMRDIIEFAVCTAMRAEEIARVTWADLDRKRKTLVIRDRKDPEDKLGNDQTVPVLESAMRVIERQEMVSERIFPYNHKTWSTIFPRACDDLGIADLRFHDLRHEGISRLFEMGYEIHEVAIFSGHKSWQNLKRYTQLKAADVRRLG